MITEVFAYVEGGLEHEEGDLGDDRRAEDGEESEEEREQEFRDLQGLEPKKKSQAQRR